MSNVKESMQFNQEKAKQCKWTWRRVRPQLGAP